MGEYTVNITTVVRHNVLNGDETVQIINALLKKKLEKTSLQPTVSMAIPKKHIKIRYRRMNIAIIRDVLSSLLKQKSINKSVVIVKVGGNRFRLELIKEVDNEDEATAPRPVKYSIVIANNVTTDMQTFTENVKTFTMNSLDGRDITMEVVSDVNFRIDIECTTYIRKGTVRNILRAFLKKNKMNKVMKVTTAGESALQIRTK